MLNMCLYSVYDSKAESYSQPFFAVNDAVARRMFEQACNDGETPVCAHPEDYTLFRVGDWSSEAGKVQGLEAPVAIARAIELKREAR